MRGRVSIVLALALVLGAGVASASAASFSISSGRDPAVAIDASGNAHVAWLAAGAGGATQLHYCMVAAGASACSRAHSITAGADNFTAVDHPSVLIAPLKTFSSAIVLAVVFGTQNLHLSGDAQNSTSIWESDDNGVTFAAPTVQGQNVRASQTIAIGGNPYSVQQHLTSNSDAEVALQGVATAPSPPTTSFATFAPPSLSVSSDATIGVFPGGKPVLAWDVAADGQNPHFAYYNAGAVSSQTSFTTGALADGGDGLSLIGGSGGSFLLEHVGLGVPRLRTFSPAAVLRTGSAFGAPNTLSCGDTSSSGFHDESAFEDDSGRLHVVFAEDQGLRYVTLTSGAQSAPVTLDAAPSLDYTPRVAANANGAGLAVWSRAASGDGAIAAARLPSPLPTTSGCGFIHPFIIGAPPGAPGAGPTEMGPADLGTTDVAATGTVDINGAAECQPDDGTDCTLDVTATACVGKAAGCARKSALAAKRRHKKGKTKVVVVAHSTTTIPSGQSAPVSFKLNARGRKLLRLNKRLKITLTAVLHHGTLPAITATRKLTLHAKKTHAKRKGKRRGRKH